MLRRIAIIVAGILALWLVALVIGGASCGTWAGERVGERLAEGIQGTSRVGDASLMPSVPRANTNVPVMMIGEKIAAAVLEGRG